MNQPDGHTSFLSLLNRKAEEREPLFDEPWQATVFALAVHLHARGQFSWPDWATTLSQELKNSSASTEAEEGTVYYSSWLCALERLVFERGLTDQESLKARIEAWEDAYRRTPHGKPVRL